VEDEGEDKTMQNLNTNEFKTKIFNYETEKEWNYLGNRPAIIDFYADWCGPCKIQGPILDKISKKYEGKIDVFKIDTEQNEELSAAFGIRSIPSLLFIPMNGKPSLNPGLLMEPQLEQVVEEYLLKG
jgi:thioredoxin